MKVSKIKIKNILGITDYEVSPGVFTEIKGRNGSGKTSLLEGIKSALSGGHDATLLHSGADVGEIVLVLDDGSEITKKVTESKSETKIRDLDGKLISSPSKALKDLSDALSVNPVEFLTAPKKDRVSALFEAMPIDVPLKRLFEICGFEAPKNMSAIDSIAYMSKEIYDSRTGTNRASKEKKATANQLLENLPTASNPILDTAELRQKLEEITNIKNNEIIRIGDKLNSFKAATNENIQQIKDMNAKLIENLKNQINDIEQQQREQIEAENAKFAEIEKKAQLQREKTNVDFVTNSSSIREKLDNAEQTQKDAAKAENARQMVDQMFEESAELDLESEKMTKAIKELEELKNDLLSKLPIPGLEVIEGEIYRDGIQFDRLNEAQRVQIAVEIAKLRSGKIGLICVDGIERLDENTYQAFKKSAIETGLQFVVTRVGDGDFEVNSFN